MNEYGRSGCCISEYQKRLNAILQEYVDVERSGTK